MPHHLSLDSTSMPHHLSQKKSLIIAGSESDLLDQGLHDEQLSGANLLAVLHCVGAIAIVMCPYILHYTLGLQLMHCAYM